MGLLLPRGVIQPFDLKFLVDDIHIIAFFEGHPHYEAVEAMIRGQGDGPPVIRAILTRHDQSQVDHVNDARRVAQAAAAPRESCPRSIVLHEERSDAGLRVRVEFESSVGEAIVLDLFSLGMPDRSRGGLSDPGLHALTSSLPVMLRGASAMAGPASRVSIGGAEFPIPVKFRRGPNLIAHHGFFTESHRMGLLRAGQVARNVSAMPQRFEAGDIDVARHGSLVERIRGRREGERLRLQEVRIDAAPEAGGGLALHFGEAGDFGIRIDGSEPLMSGRAACRESDHTAEIDLEPLRPDWAIARPVRIRLDRDGERVITTTTIGPSSR